MGIFRDMFNEARNSTVPTEYRIAFGQLKRMYNPGEVPSEKELQKDAEMIAKKNHIEEDKFLEFALAQFNMNEAKITAKEFIEDAETYVKNFQDGQFNNAKLFRTKVINRLKEKRNKATGNAKAELIKAIEELSNDGDLSEAKITKSDSGKYTLVNGVIQITKKELAKIHKDYKSDNTILTMIGGVTTAVPFAINESAVGTPGRTTVKDAEDHIDDELVAEFRKIIKKIGGKTVAKVLLDKLGQKSEIKDEIEHIEDIIDNSNY